MHFALMLAAVLLVFSCRTEYQDRRDSNKSRNSSAGVIRISASIIEDKESFIFSYIPKGWRGGELRAELVEAPAAGEVSCDEETSECTFTPEQYQFGDEFFSVKVSDAGRHFVYIEIELEIIGVDNPPITADQVIELDEDTFVEFELDAREVDGEEMSIEIIQEAKHGVVEWLNEEMTRLRYTPDPDYFGDDFLVYRASDGKLASPDTTVRFVVHPVNDPPILSSSLVCSKMNEQIPIPLYGVDRVENDPLTYSPDPTRPNQLRHGRISVFAATAGVATYEANQGFVGWDDFDVRVSDGMDYSPTMPMYVVVHQVDWRAAPGQTIEADIAPLVEAPAFQFLADPLTGLRFQESSSPRFMFTVPENASVGTVIDLNFVIRLGALESRNCGLKIEVIEGE
jgi:hypothetical protein